MVQPIRQYKDLDLNLEVHPNTKDLVYVKDAEAVKRAVKNIVLTSYYERHFDDFFGSDVKASLFDNMSPVTVVNIQESIMAALSNFEPRVILDDITVLPEEDYNRYSVTIIFHIKNIIQPIAVNLFLEKVR